jgi:DNA-binding Xre family transcriptional regulator
MNTPPDNQYLAQLDARLKELANQIDANEAELKRLQDEGEGLRARLHNLVAARNIIVHELGADSDGQSSVVMPMLQASGSGTSLRPTLKARVLKVLRSAEGKDGMSAAQVTDKLIEQGFGSTAKNKNTFYSMVYLTLTRLVTSGTVRAVQGDKGRRFVAKNLIKGMP